VSWRKGFFRLWVVFTVLWVSATGFWAFVKWIEYDKAVIELSQLDRPAQKSSSSLTEEQAKAIEEATAKARKKAENNRRDAQAYLIMNGTVAVAAPVVVLALGALLGWAFLGFRQGQDNADP